MAPPEPPCWFCTMYSCLTLANDRRTFSRILTSSVALPDGCTMVMTTSVMVIFRYSSGVPPALRTVSLASGACLPVTQYLNRLGVARST